MAVRSRRQHEAVVDRESVFAVSRLGNAEELLVRAVFSDHARGIQGPGVLREHLEAFAIERTAGWHGKNALKERNFPYAHGRSALVDEPRAEISVPPDAFEAHSMRMAFEFFQHAHLECEPVQKLPCNPISHMPNPPGAFSDQNGAAADAAPSRWIPRTGPPVPLCGSPRKAWFRGPCRFRSPSAAAQDSG